MGAYRPYCFKIFHDGRYPDSGRRSRRFTDECYSQPCTEYAPYAENEQPCPKNACLRNNGSHHRHLYRQDRHTDTESDASA